MLNLHQIQAGYEKTTILQNVDIRFQAGEFCAFVGPNGAGKSTLLRVISGQLIPTSGEVLIHNRKLSAWKKKDLAFMLGIIPQEIQLQFDFRIEELVMMGRYPYLDAWESIKKEDKAIVDALLDRLELASMRQKYYSELSGGEKQRVMLARVLAQQAKIILLDESFSNLDIAHVVDMLQILKDLTEKEEKLVLLVSHNLNLSANFCSRMVMLKEGAIFADGTPEATMTEANLSNLFSIPLQTVQNPASHKPNLLYPGAQ